MSNSNNSNGMDWVSLAAAGASVLGNIIGSGMTNKRARAAQRRQHNYALKEMDYQFGLNKQAFDLENEYNSPLAQRQRMYEAGLNPNFSDRGSNPTYTRTLKPQYEQKYQECQTVGYVRHNASHGCCKTDYASIRKCFAMGRGLSI